MFMHGIEPKSGLQASAPTRSLSFRAALLPSGLAREVAIAFGPGGVIESVKPGAPPWDGFLAVPAMINAHSHVFQRALAGHGEARGTGVDSFWTWREVMYRLADRITPSQMYAVARRGFSEMLLAGFTEVLEFHYVHHPPGARRGRDVEMAGAVSQAALDAGIRLGLLPAYYKCGGFGGLAPSPGQARFLHTDLDDFFATVSALLENGVPVAGVAAHSLRAVPAEELPGLVERADQAIGECPVHIHISEQAREQEECVVAHGCTPVTLLADSVALGPRWQLVHATHATGSQRSMIRRLGAGVVLCPLTEAHLGDGIFPAVEHFEEGGSAAIGTDANTRVSVIGELRVLEYGQRLRDRRRARIATEGGAGGPAWAWAAASGEAAARPARGGRLRGGAIEPGRRADLVVLDEAGPAIAGHGTRTALDAWLVGGDNRDISAVYLGGRRVVDGGSLETGADESETTDKFRKAMAALDLQDKPPAAGG